MTHVADALERYRRRFKLRRKALAARLGASDRLTAYYLASERELPDGAIARIADKQLRSEVAAARILELNDRGAPLQAFVLKYRALTCPSCGVASRAYHGHDVCLRCLREKQVTCECVACRTGKWPIGAAPLTRPESMHDGHLVESLLNGAG